VGANGTGKSTLLKIITKELSPDSGDVILAKDTTIGYLAQHNDAASENTIYEEMLTVKQDILDMEHSIRSIETHMKNASSSASSSSSKMVKDVTGDLEKIEKQADDSFGGVSDTSKSDWSAADLSVEDALKLMRGASSEQMRAIYKNVESYTNSIYNITTNNWSALSLRVPQLMDEMNGSISEKLETTKSLFANFGSHIAGSLNLFWAGRSAIQQVQQRLRSFAVCSPGKACFPGVLQILQRSVFLCLLPTAVPHGTPVPSPLSPCSPPSPMW
jgi:phage-related protein